MLDGKSFEVLATVKTNYRPEDVASLSGINRFYITDDDGTVHAFDATTFGEVGRLLRPHALPYLTSNIISNRLFSTSYLGIDIIDGLSFKIIASIHPGGGRPIGGRFVAVNSLKNQVYWTSNSLDSAELVSTVDGETSSLN